MDFFVSTKRIGDGGAVSGEGRRVEHNEIPAWDKFLVGLGLSLGFEPIEHSGGLEGAFVGEAIDGGSTCGTRNRVAALIHQMNVGGTGTGGVQGEPTQKTEAVEDLCT